MPSASNTSNSSNIRSSELKIAVQRANDGSRLIVTLAANIIGETLTAGDVIRYDVLTSKYKKAIATSLAESEVFGIVETVNTDGSASVVTYGSITYPSIRLINLDSSVNYGGNDIYFLSDTQAGRLQNIPPNAAGYIVKPVYQRAPHGSSYTGTVVNYVGYSIVNTG